MPYGSVAKFSKKSILV
ncbi:Putative uncharacterized protein [Lactococcus lactis subsp. lactis A12]|uniref:Uncharacterized protein n=1 Tax=Lactococcus lactis subsp. lactis A12 TaxID=1137134 RepID=S6ER44_LACLL|nr:Putative uncharacterized protein [Lactococcus lactis subsp. lactis A12]